MYTSYVFSYIGQSPIENTPHNAYSTKNLHDEKQFLLNAHHFQCKMQYSDNVI